MTNKTSFYGSVTVGTKGQVVIPADARDDFNIKSGDKLVIIGIKERNMLGVCPVESVETLLEELTNKLKSMREALDETKSKQK